MTTNIVVCHANTCVSSLHMLMALIYLFYANICVKMLIKVFNHFILVFSSLFLRNKDLKTVTENF